MAELTPMMQQYFEIKERNKDCILFFRLGDFYEMFDEDARLASRELDLTLTSRDRGKEKDEDKIPMCGIPYHASEGYISRLIAKGHKVAICEQTEDPALAKGLVKRDIIRVVTPGSLTESTMLEEGKNNYFAGIFGEGTNCGLAMCDLSTGAFYVTTISAQQETLLTELGRFQPSEILLIGTVASDRALQDAIMQKLPCCLDTKAPENCTLASCTAMLEKQFGKSVYELGLQDANAAILAAGALLLQLLAVQKHELPHISRLEVYRSGHYMELDLTARRNLELTQTLRSQEKKGSLLWVLDHTKTPMGGRLLRSWLDKPLLQPRAIGYRLESVQALCDNTIAREELHHLLAGVSDFERIMTRVVTGTANCRDFVAFAAGCTNLPEIRARLSGFTTPLLQELAENLDPMEDIRALLEEALVENPPFTVREGGMFREGYRPELDELNRLIHGSKELLSEIEAKEKEKTGIRNLRIGYNRVFGYYIEVSKGQTSMVPDSYIRKQTLVNCERYITPELKELEQSILTAKDRACALEYDLYCNLRDRLAEQSERARRTAQAIAAGDVLVSFAVTACAQSYCRPVVDQGMEIEIVAGRHPVVEKMLKNELFVPNDTALGVPGGQVSIITGPNMAGKSTYMRQVALIVLMAQVGSFVPAKSAHIGVVDRIFTRIGASDDLSAGQSTFMVEMAEVAETLRCATGRSLLILDEIGRGTSTFDGMAIAQAVLEYVANPLQLGARTLFATHYHELSRIENQLSNVKNYNIAVKKRGDTMIFLRKIIPGATDDSFGVEVAKLAGLPEKVVRRARQLLKALEDGRGAVPYFTAREKAAAIQDDGQMAMTDPNLEALRTRLEAVSVETLTPIEALNLLYQLKQSIS